MIELSTLKYNDKFTLNVLDLNQIELATEEDRQWKLDYWARLLKTRTWEELKMLSQQDEIFQETCETVFRLNQDDEVRYWCEACEDSACSLAICASRSASCRSFSAFCCAMICSCSAMTLFSYKIEIYH